MINHLPIYFLLILLCFLSLAALILSEDKIKKILCLSFIYSNFAILMIALAIKLNKQNEILRIIDSVLILFAINLLIGFAIAKNTQKTKQVNLTDED